MKHKINFLRNKQYCVEAFTDLSFFISKLKVYFEGSSSITAEFCAIKATF